MKATDLLKEQHRKVEKLFAALEGEGGDKKALRAELGACLVAHDAIEREIFYPAMRKVEGMTDDLHEAYEEHGLVEFALKKLLDVRTSDSSFDAKVKVLKEIVEHHVEEEEDELLKHADKEMSTPQLEQLAIKMKAKFDEIHDGGKFETLLDAALGLSGRRAVTTTEKKTRKQEKKAPPRRATGPAAKRAAAKRPAKRASKASSRSRAR